MIRMSSPMAGVPSWLAAGEPGRVALFVAVFQPAGPALLEGFFPGEAGVPAACVVGAGAVVVRRPGRAGGPAALGRGGGLALLSGGAALSGGLFPPPGGGGFLPGAASFRGGLAALGFA